MIGALGILGLNILLHYILSKRCVFDEKINLVYTAVLGKCKITGYYRKNDKNNQKMNNCDSNNFYGYSYPTATLNKVTATKNATNRNREPT